MKKWIILAVAVVCLIIIGLVGYFIPAVWTNMLGFLRLLGVIFFVLVAICLPIAIGVGAFELCSNLISNWVISVLMVILVGMATYAIGLAGTYLAQMWVVSAESMDLSPIPWIILGVYGVTLFLSWIFSN